MDLNAIGSRFTNRVAFAVQRGRGGASPRAEGSETGDAEAVVADLLAGVDATERSDLGAHEAVEGSHGRGASSWIPVVEFALTAGIAGIIGNAAWEQLKKRARQVRDLLESFRSQDAQVLVSRGAAAFAAIAHVVEGGEVGVLDIEAVEEPSALAGRDVTELNYVGYEPWLVSLLNEDRTTRYLVAVAPNGEIVGSMRMPMSQFESLYGVLSPRD